MNNIKGYNIIAKDKKVSDLFLGTLDINWKFAKIGYNLHRGIATDILGKDGLRYCGLGWQGLFE